jgi:hypothetical protein
MGGRGVTTTHQHPINHKETAMTSTLNHDLTTLLTGLAAQLAGILDQKNSLEEHERRIKSQIRELVPGPDSYDAGGLTVTISTNNRFSPDKALPLIPVEFLPIVTRTETVVDKDKLKALLPHIFEQAQTAGDYRVGLK